MKKLIKFFSAVDVLGCIALLGYALYSQEAFWWLMFAVSLAMVVLSPAKRIQAAIEKKFLSSKKKQIEEQTSGKFFPSKVGEQGQSGSPKKEEPTTVAATLIKAQSFKSAPRGYSVILNSTNKHNKLKPEHLNHAGSNLFSAPGTLKISEGELKKF